MDRMKDSDSFGTGSIPVGATNPKIKLKLPKKLSYLLGDIIYLQPEHKLQLEK